jgi:hypothetical protein
MVLLVLKYLFLCLAQLLTIDSVWLDFKIMCVSYSHVSLCLMENTFKLFYGLLIIVTLQNLLLFGIASVKLDCMLHL